MNRPRRIRRTRTDTQRIEHLAEADGNTDRLVELEIDTDRWLAGSVVSAVQVQVLDGRTPAEAMDRGSVDAGPEHGRGKQDEGDPQ